jgi:hypothetical protein
LKGNWEVSACNPGGRRREGLGSKRTGGKQLDGEGRRFNKFTCKAYSAEGARAVTIKFREFVPDRGSGFEIQGKRRNNNFGNKN